MEILLLLVTSTKRGFVRTRLRVQRDLYQTMASHEPLGTLSMGIVGRPHQSPYYSETLIIAEHCWLCPCTHQHRVGIPKFLIPSI